MGMHVHLTPEQERLVNDELQTGHYHSVEEVIGEALRALMEREPRFQANVRRTMQREAVHRMLEFAQTSAIPLEGISIRDLIHEGHRL